MKGKTDRSGEPWMTRKKAYICFSSNDLVNSLKNAEGSRSTHKRVIQWAKRRHKKALTDKRESKGFYKYIKGKRLTQERKGSLKDLQCSLCVEAQISEVLNEYICIYCGEKQMLWNSGNVTIITMP